MDLKRNLREICSLLDGVDLIGVAPSYGPRVKLSVVITEAPLEGDTIIVEDLCADCEICVNVCPSGALKKPVKEARPNYDRFVCYSFYTANEGCGLCMSKCPR